MAALRVDNAGVALSEFLKARVTVPLIEAFVGFSVAVNTVNATAENKLHLLIDLWVQRNFIVTEPGTV